jgi:hypothetical protein
MKFEVTYTHKIPYAGEVEQKIEVMAINAKVADEKARLRIRELYPHQKNVFITSVRSVLG